MKILIVDDEQLARDRTRRMLEKVGGYEVAGEAANGMEAVTKADELGVDVVLMDIRMPGMDGLEAAGHIAKMEQAPAVIFCTAYGEYALNAFEVQAVGYLLKPVRQEALADALEKARSLNKVQLASLSSELSDSEDNKPSRSHISAKTRRGIELVPIDNICYFMADHKYVTVRHGSGEVLIDDTLKELETEFDNRFVRIHRNALVAIRYIEGLEREEQGVFQVRLKGLEERLTVSRRHVAGLRKLMQSL